MAVYAVLYPALPVARADLQLSGKAVARELDLVIAFRQWPRVDQQYHSDLNADNQADWHYIAAGKPVQNAFIETFKSPARLVLQRETLFISLRKTRAPSRDSGARCAPLGHRLVDTYAYTEQFLM